MSTSNPAKSQLTTGADQSSEYDSRADVEDALRLFVDPGDIQPRSQGPATGKYYKPVESSPPLLTFLKTNFNIIIRPRSKCLMLSLTFRLLD